MIACHDCIYEDGNVCTNDEQSFDLDDECLVAESKATYDKGYQQGRADENERVLNILHNFYEVRNHEQNDFMNKLCMEVMRELLKESEETS